MPDEEKPQKKTVKKRKTTRKKPVKKTTKAEEPVKKEIKKEKKKTRKPGTKKNLVWIGIAIVVVILGLLSVEFLTKSEPEPTVEEVLEQVAVTPVEEITVRPPAVAGTWYPEWKSVLRDEIGVFFFDLDNQLENTKVPALIVPHAEIDFSGAVAAAGYKTVADKNFKRAIIIGPSHHVQFEGVALTSYDAWRTPLGNIRVAETDLADDQVFRINDEALAEEHSIEVQVPFLQVLFPDIEIVPLAVGTMDEASRATAATKIGALLDEQTLLVISSDLSHYHEAAECETIDRDTIDKILTGEPEQVAEIDACGVEPILIAILIANEREWGRQELVYANSGDATGDDSSVVGYTAIAFTAGEAASSFEQFEVSAEQQQYLLELARTTIETYLIDGTTYVPEEPDDEFLTAVRGAFVTLTIDDELRGCIGHTVAQEALYLSVRDNAINAAVNDSRFDPLTVEELNSIKIEVSILTDSEPVSLYAIQKGVDGVILSQPSGGATFLPKVWEDFDSFTGFMEALSLKAGLKKDAWKSDLTEFARYRAKDFAE
ncbi:MAG: AmmeMemoRadiSam system protein B [Candidatus Uhrbacteria bacterium]|nr:AmmeMemoRadiSam system protein B [Patescibacteria group bacterium]MBU1906791.1 AmmeMemoRadiSam system protein B [Patescibacteria group bacterium]